MASIPAHAATILWPPDDTEESVVGVDRHQLDIVSLRTGINEEAYRLARGGPLPWQAITQIILLGCRRPDESAYTVLPDVFVFPRPMDRTRGSYSLRQDGPPVLIIEVASKSTYAIDLDTAGGKAWSYAQAGVREYLVLDPTRQYVPTLGRGWRLRGGVYVPWRPDRRGRWRCQTIPLAIGIEDGLAAVYGADGRRQLREGEVGRALTAQYAEGRAEGRVEGRAEGRAEGAIEGKREALRRLARRRVGVAPALEQRIDAADEPALDALLDHIFNATDHDQF